MTMEDLYDHMKSALHHFDLTFHEMDKVNVTLDADGIHFQPKAGGTRITVLKDYWK